MMGSGTFGILCFATGFGGLEINTIRLVKWMQERGWKVALLLREGTAICKKAIEEGLSVTVVPGDQSERQDIRAIDEWVCTSDLQLIFLCYNKDIKLAARYKRRKNNAIRLVYQQHMQVGVKKRDFIHTRRYKMLDAWISPLQYLKEETIEKTKVDPAKIHVIPFGFEPKTFQNSEWTRDAARASFSLPQESLIIGVLGRIDPKKGQDLVIKGVHRLNEQHHIDCHLLLVGDATINEGDSYSRELGQLIDQLQLKNRVHLFAYQPDVMQFFRAINIFAMPSHGETFGMVTLEAMAAGVPVVGTGRDGTKEILRDGAFGYLFPLNDVDAFCKQVIEVLTNKQLPEMLQAAMKEIERTYGYGQMCDQIGALIRSLLLPKHN